MVGAHRNVGPKWFIRGLHDHALFRDEFVVQALGLATINLPITFEVFTLYLHPLQRYEKVYKMWKWGGLG